MGTLVIHSPTHGLKEVFYDDEDHELISMYTWHIYKWCKGNKTFYARTNLPNDKMTSMQHVIMGSIWIDHINGNGLDNRRCNLRKSTQLENLLNKRVRSDCKSGYKGVGIRVAPNNGRIFYQVACKYKGRKVHGGYFDNPIDAARK